MRQWVEALEKAELHVHLEGAVYPDVLLELGVDLSPDQIAAKYTYADFNGFIEAFKWVVGCLRTPDDFALVTRRLLERLAAQNVRYAEIILSVGVMFLRKQDAAAIYDAVVREAARSPVEVWWICDAVRQFGAEHVMEVARFAADRAQDRVVAFGVGGKEALGPVEWFADSFALAREQGLKLVPHAGETEGPESVWNAVRMGAARIGHGIRAAGDPALTRYLRDHDIPLELSITSNVATGAVAGVAVHPVRRLFDAGVPIVLNTDDPAMFHTSLSAEFDLAAGEFGFTEDEIRAVAANGFRYGFRSAPTHTRPSLPAMGQ
ncbi:MAG: adenosine deaminase [Bryobacterales bacterium]|nr:adenosine deaminase [Bryobacterales bacterium]